MINLMVGGAADNAKGQHDYLQYFTDMQCQPVPTP
jgi:hypothetical protein